MNTQEAKFWQTELRDGFNALGHCCRVESHSTCVGIPDVNLHLTQGPEWWIEIKTAIGADKVEVRPAQWGWHKRRRQIGGRCMFLTKWTPSNGTATRYLVNINGPFVKDDMYEWAERANLIMLDEFNWRLFEEVLRNDRHIRK